MLTGNAFMGMVCGVIVKMTGGLFGLI
jgi:hypothetical protein